MSKNTISLAKWGMQPELSALWMDCFSDTRRGVRYFFANAFRPENCLTLRAGETLAAALYLLPVRLLRDGAPAPAQYIYAAGTRPEFRSRGYMRALLNCAAYLGRRRGDLFSILLPASESLSRYYAACGYEPYFLRRTVTLGRDEAEREAAGPRSYWEVLPDYRAMAALRRAQLRGAAGSALWSPREIAYAAGVNRVYGGNLLCVKTAKGEAYALFRAPEAGVCEVVEWMGPQGALPALLRGLLDRCPADRFRFRLPENSAFAGEGAVAPAGMAKPLREEPLPAGEDAPYLGLPLD